MTIVAVDRDRRHGRRAESVRERLRAFRHPHAAGIMNFVVMSAALSSMNTNIYLCSRMLFSLSRGCLCAAQPRETQQAAARRSRPSWSPVPASWSPPVSMLTPHAYNYLFGVALFDAMIVWIIHPAQPLELPAAAPGGDLPVRMPLFPWMQLAGLTAARAVLVTMGLDRNSGRLVDRTAFPGSILISAAYFLWRARDRRASTTRAAARAAPLA